MIKWYEPEVKPKENKQLIIFHQLVTRDYHRGIFSHATYKDGKWFNSRKPLDKNARFDTPLRWAYNNKELCKEILG